MTKVKDPRLDLQFTWRFVIMVWVIVLGFTAGLALAVWIILHALLGLINIVKGLFI